MDYGYTDRIIAAVDAQIVKKFMRLKSLLAIDEVDVIGVIGILYKDLAAMVREQYRRIARHYYAGEHRGADRKEIDRLMDADWIDEILSAPDEVSKYVFANEEDRRRARLAEAILAGGEPGKEADAAKKALSFMYRLYAVRMTDEAVLQGMKDDGAQYVQWVAESDAKTCSICAERNGKIYLISQVPAKPHVNCRCTYRRVKGSK